MSLSRAVGMSRSRLAWCCSLGLLLAGCRDDGARSEPDTGTAASPASGEDGEETLDGGRPLDASDPDEPGDASSSRADGCPADAPQPVNRVRFVPAPGKAARMVGGRIEGSNTGPTNDFVTLATIKSAPAEGRATELRFANDKLYRYIKYYAPEGSYGSVAEVEFYHDDTRLMGESFGTANGADAQRTFASALDANPATIFESKSPDGSYVGLDIARGYVTAAPTFSPGAGRFDTPPMVTLASATAGATIRYTLDGSNPARAQGQTYRAPFALSQGRVPVNAIASSKCRFDSPVSEATYAVGPQAAPVSAMKTYHVGNSLTDTINGWLKPIADSAGAAHTFARWTIPGATVKWIWEHPGGGFGEPEGANQLTTFVRSSYAPITHMTVQPFSDPSINLEGAAAVKMFEAALAGSPDLQPWIYAQWPPMTEWKTDVMSIGASWSEPPWVVPSKPTSWDEAVQNHMRYHEAFRAYVDERIGGKPVRIVPGGLALLALKQAVDQGRVPGMSNFFQMAFSDDLHLTARASYLVALVFYSSFYQTSPEGRVTSEGSQLTAEQARIFQRIAWDTVRNYAPAGVSAP